MDELIEPAWAKYIQTLPIRHPGRIAYIDISLSLIARTNGFRELEDTIIRNFPSTTDPIFSATLDTMREFALSCRLKKPKKLKSRRSDRKPEEFCYFCGENTELFASSQGENKPGYNPDESAARLSSKYCAGHRPKYLDQTRNSIYLSANRNRVAFKTELSRLERQRSSSSKSRAQSGDPDVDMFYLRLIASKAAYLDEESVLRNEARRLVDKRIDDTKKRIVMLRVKGFSHNAIAKLIGMNSRQAVSKALTSVCHTYRFDLKFASKNPDQIFIPLLPPLTIIEKIKVELGETVIAALNDPDICEIDLNCDGRLWVDRISNEKLLIGNMPAEQAENLIRLIAKNLAIQLTQKNEVVVGDLPFSDAHFFGVLPPYFDNPVFVIRKRRI
jgi:hypothetical protein